MKIIFIIGNSRSGTTMLANILGNAKDTMVFKELHFFDRLTKSIGINERISNEKTVEIYAKLIASNTLEPWNVNQYVKFIDDAKTHLSDKTLNFKRDIIKLYIDTTLFENNKLTSVEQTPKNSYHIEEISKSFSNYNFIHIIRDPRAILISQKNKWKRYKLGGVPSRHETFRAFINQNPLITSIIYYRTINKINRDKIIINNNNFVELKYEDILENPNIIIKELFLKLKLDFSEDNLNIRHTSSSFVSNKKLTTGINKTRSKTWEMQINSAELFICQIINRKILKSYEYKYVKVFPNLLLLIFYILIIPMQSILIIFFNLNEVISILKKILNNNK